MVAHLSKILNECNNADGALACALAIDGITLLCKFEVIDAVTTWATLAPMFKSENRIPVIKSLCSLISEIPNLSYTEAYPKLIEEVVSKLWEYTILNPDKEVGEAALNALTSFSVEQIMAQMPDEYLNEETLTSNKSRDVIPGQCWLHFLKNCDARKLEVAGDFLIKMVALEISNYLKFVYQVKGTREPTDYSYLPTNSVVRGISTYIKSKMFKWKGSVYKEVYLQCLRIFSQEYSKPLPPLDWCFLQELVHEPEAKNFCINIASHQVVLSGTARRFMVNYIEAIIENHTNENDVLIIYSNLKHLANSVQPFTLKPFLELTIYHAVELFKNDNEEQLLTILKHLKATLNDETIQESNKIVIAQIISSVVDDIDISSKLFEVLLECIILFPVKCIADLSSPKSVKEVRVQWLKKAIKIRCHVALYNNDTPLNWLNELMEIGSSFPGVTTFMFEQFALVFQKHKDNTECVLWVLELIGQIQAVIADKSEEKEILFLCNIFILATIAFSGHFVLLQDFSSCEEMYRLFPRAVATLLEVNHWSICTTQVGHLSIQYIFTRLHIFRL
ncbi:uncharacterized protein BDFB_008470, partial [Asbolus verrucosus]